MLRVVGRAVRRYARDNMAMPAAALAFAAVFSIFPLVLFLISLAGLFVSQDLAEQWVLANVQLVGTGAGLLTDTITDLLKSKSASGTAATIGLVGLIFSASGVFSTLQRAVNRAWECTTETGLVLERVIAAVMVFGVLLVLLASTIISTILSAIQQGTSRIIGDLPWLCQVINIVSTNGLATVVLAVLFRSLPRCKVHWADVWFGALLTALLWSLVQQVFAIYLGSFANYQAVYGALGGMIALQTWIFLSSQILLWGAEVCAEYALERQMRAGATLLQERITELR
jgi:membrane protein